MPSTYAHYRFGVQMLSNMPADVRRTIQRFRQLFDVGLHGPDIFFYGNLLPNIGTAHLGKKYHDQTGEEFFTRVCRGLRLEPSEAAAAYLYGVLCHYCLDTACHPYVRQSAEKGEVTHAQLETEFDRRLLETDGKIPAHTQDLSQHLHLTPGECDTVARFYPPATAGNVKGCVKSMSYTHKILATPEGMGRKVLSKGAGLLSKKYEDTFMGEAPLTLCGPYLPGLLERYAQAEAKFPQMLVQLQAHMTYSAPFGEEFQGKFD